MLSQQSKYERFKALHERTFVTPNPWDAGSARLLASLGFEALATTSAGYAFSKGKLDSFASLERNEIFDNAAEIVGATTLPVSADLGDGFGDAPEVCAETIRLAAKIGLVGGSIEDATGDPTAPIYGLSQAVERVQAAAEAARDLPFLLTARAENFLWDKPDLEAIRTVCASVDKPVNVVMGLKGSAFSVGELSEAGVRRTSVGGSFARAALGALMRAAEEVKATGTFTYAEDALPGSYITKVMALTKQDERQ
ncbi:oxaloacetate decarboxylase [Aquamicrobium segne]|uniref:Oxaloacetate decarboxylase n=1 Tax=Aquamicrobium segne TaxID=469547 RepID=A0ABW0H0S4_9HYPH